MSSPTKIKGLIVLLKTDKGIFQVKLGSDVKYRILQREIDVKKIVLVGEDLTNVFTNLKK